MATALRYFAQPFWSDRTSAAQTYEFACAVDAEEGARLLLAGGAEGVIAWMQIYGERCGFVGEREVLVTLGDFPRSLLAIDPDGPDAFDQTEAA